MHAKQQAAHFDFTATLPAKEVEKWRVEVDAWHEDPHGSSDLFEEPRISESASARHV